MSDNIQYDIINDIEKKETLSPFQTLVNEYLSKNKPVVYLLTPCFASLCYVNYVHCLMNTIETFRQYNIELTIEFCRNDSLISRARNNLVARAMANPRMTHIMFIDNDISWDPNDILKLLISEKNLVGGIYPLKNYNWKDLIVDNKDPTNPNPNISKKGIDEKNNSQFKNAITYENAV
jgi:hypothetical protein